MLVAIVTDAIQILLLPLFAVGALSPADTVIDLIVAVILSRLIGWHWAFLPTIFAELIPVFDLFPTWTAAVLYVSWQRRVPSDQPDIFPSERPASGRFLNP